MSATAQRPMPLHELAPGLARGGPGRSLNVTCSVTSWWIPGCAGAAGVSPASSPGGSSYGSPFVNRLQRTLAPVTAHPVSRTLGEGEVVAGFEVVEVPGHSPGALAFWRQRDRVLVCGDVLANFGLRPSRPRLVLAPAALSSDYEQNRRSAARLAELRPRLACFGHGSAITDPGRFAAALDRLGPTSS